MITVIIWCVILKLIPVYSERYDEASCLGDKDVFGKRLGEDMILGELYFHLYSKEWFHTPLNLTSNNIRLLNGTLDTKIIIPGWTEQSYEEWVISMKNAYLSKQPFNIIVFDWGQYTYYPYEMVPDIVKTCGKYLGDFLILLYRENVIDLDKVHVIAHSVGAHIAGLAGKHVQKHLAKNVFRISALNAAGPKYEEALPADRLFRNDAKIVDGYHAHDGVFGMRRAYGTVDFFLSQKDPQLLKCLIPPEISCYSIYIWIRCRHRDTFDLWLRSIIWGNLTAIGIVRKDRILIGEQCPQAARGIYNHIVDIKPALYFRRAECLGRY
ncbi:hypothetical protein Trydic_g21569 [Trypoxylus dichotomus]